jgi:hypothetical protein
VNGELAQLIALTGHSNAFLAGQLLESPELLQTNSTFQYVAAVRFEVPGGWVDGTADWMESLRTRALRTRLCLRESDPAGTGFAGASPGSVECGGASGWRAWTPHWKLGDPDAAENRIWHVTYRFAPPSESYRSPDLAAATRELAGALEQAEEVARRESSPFKSWFGEARSLLCSDDPVAPYHPDMLPGTGYSLDARRLLAAATRAWVFGGMESWNDFVARDPQRYEAATARLYRGVLTSFTASVNSFDASHEGSRSP